MDTRITTHQAKKLAHEFKEPNIQKSGWMLFLEEGAKTCECIMLCIIAIPIFGLFLAFVWAIFTGGRR